VREILKSVKTKGIKGEGEAFQAILYFGWGRHLPSRGSSQSLEKEKCKTDGREWGERNVGGGSKKKRKYEEVENPESY